MSRLPILYAFIACIPSFAQVNDNIEDRSILYLDSQFVHSDTRSATVQWHCIDKRLTGECLTYHNDQWFQFTVPTNGKYYFDIQDQVCEHDRGIQLVLIAGDPCKAETYQILKCIPKLPKVDGFVSLDSLASNQTYLVNIDGFLKDNCSFKIGLTSRAQGVPYDVPTLDTLDVDIRLATEEQVVISWTTNELLLQALEGFVVYRSSSEERETKVAQLGMSRNSFGTPLPHYTVVDTLSQNGIYHYHIYGIQNDGDIIPLQVSTFHFRQEGMLYVRQHEVLIEMDYKKGTDIEVYIYDPGALRMYKYYYYQVENRSEKLHVNLASLINAGHREFLIRLVNKRSDIRNFVYKLDESGKLILQP